MSDHTPGPWFVQKSDYPGGLLIKPIPGQVIAQCDEGLDMNANARLIAAAPALLAVTRGFRQKLATYLSVYPGDTELKELLIECDDAITKATGATP